MAKFYGGGGGSSSGSVTISNGAGAAAVNIQDGGNSITVDGAVTEANSAAILTGINTLVSTPPASGIQDQTPFAVGSTKVNLMGGEANETATDSVSEGDVGAIRMSLRRAIKNDMDTLIAGEDQSNNKMVVEHQYSGTQCTADTQVKASAGFIHTITLQGTDAVPTAGTIVVYDNTAESGTEICRFDIKATAVADAFDGASMILDRICTTGIYVGFTTTTDVAVQVTWR